MRKFTGIEGSSTILIGADGVLRSGSSATLPTDECAGRPEQSDLFSDT